MQICQSKFECSLTLWKLCYCKCSTILQFGLKKIFHDLYGLLILIVLCP